jgi:hypothetical protein
LANLVNPLKRKDHFMADIPGWLQSIIDQVTAAPTDAKVETLLQLVDNEMQHGLGLTAPSAVTAGLLAAAAAIATAIAAAPPSGAGATGATGATGTAASTGTTTSSGTTSSRSST